MGRVFATLSSAFFAAACAAAPPPPREPREVTALAALYANPSANLEPALMGSVLEQTAQTRAALEAVSGLRFVQDVVRDATAATSDTTDFDLEVQGSAIAHAACPGWDDGRKESPADGYIEVTIGIARSHIQRAFSGFATNCKFLTTRAGQRANVVASMALQIDLGSDLALGETAGALLVRATNVTGTIDGVGLTLGSQVFSFRFAEDESVETLIDLEPMRLGLKGTCLLGLRPDGVWTLETRSGAWICGDSGSGPCVPDRA